VPIIAARVLVVAAVGLALLYGLDTASVRVRMARQNAGDPIAQVTIYYGTWLKNGKVEVFYEAPETRLCVRSLFPHGGHSPCWYLQWRKVQLI
jgi:hypothetical protein